MFRNISNAQKLMNIKIYLEADQYKVHFRILGSQKCCLVITIGEEGHVARLLIFVYNILDFSRPFLGRKRNSSCVRTSSTP